MNVVGDQAQHFSLFIEEAISLNYLECNVSQQAGLQRACFTSGAQKSKNTSPL